MHLLYTHSMYSSSRLQKCKPFPFSMGMGPKLKPKNASCDHVMIHEANTNKVY